MQLDPPQTTQISSPQIPRAARFHTQCLYDRKRQSGVRGGGARRERENTHEQRSQSSASSPERKRQPLKRGGGDPAICLLQCALKHLRPVSGAKEPVAPAVAAAAGEGEDDIAELVLKAPA